MGGSVPPLGQGRQDGLELGTGTRGGLELGGDGSIQPPLGQGRRDGLELGEGQYHTAHAGVCGESKKCTAHGADEAVCVPLLVQRSNELFTDGMSTASALGRKQLIIVDSATPHIKSAPVKYTDGYSSSQPNLPHCSHAI